ncbi:MAG: SH3 domain-containing protein [Coleofasciculus chthonoplastes F3-SA18-01]|uniref:SH3 domain-containing protein n=1 Tax=Coleofasciculus chthonoplastes TaxID=64178 RepID=UPI0032FCBA78
MRLSGIAKFFIGFILGIAILLAGGGAVAYYFFTKLSVNPAKPIFAEEQQAKSPVKSPDAAKKPAQSAQKPKPSPSPTPSESPEPEELPPGAYEARVTWPEGLSLRDSPSLSANRIGGIAYNQEIIILKESDDKKWQRVRLSGSEEEGWVKAGNVERVE